MMSWRFTQRVIAASAMGVAWLAAPAAEAQTGPDLRIDSVLITSEEGAFVDIIHFSVGIHNGGDTESAATTLRYYRSADATISTSDTEEATEAIAAVAPSSRVNVGVDDIAGQSATYYYGVCVDAVAGESDTTNNCSGAVQIIVVPRSPDLVVGSPLVSDSSPAEGAAFTLSVERRNGGNGYAAGTTLRYYQSADATIAASDTEVGTYRVSGLASSAARLHSVELTAPSSGTYYYGACVDAVAGESDTTNNCSASVRVDVPAPAPDLEVSEPTPSDSNPVAGEAFTLSTTVRNRGTEAAAATTLRYYRSTDATITVSDTEEATGTVAGLPASLSYVVSAELTAPTTPGTYYYGACVDAVADESDTTNNCSSSVQITTQSGQQQRAAADLVVDPPSVSDGSPAAGAAFTLTAEVENAGDGDAAATTLRYYQSADATITASDTEVGTDAVAGLAAAATSSQSVELTAPSAGTYYYGACVDAVAGESDTANNCSAPVQVDVPAAPTQISPNLVVGQPSVSDSNPTAGAAFTLSAEVRNGGDGDAAATTLRYYQSADATITASDAEVGTDAVAGLASSAASLQSVELTAPSAGTYYYGACVDAVAGESDTANNCSAAVQVDVPAPGQRTSAPDLEVGQAQVTDSNPTAGAAFTLSAEVRNGGDGDAAATTLRYYQSADATITASDAEVGTDAVAGLASSAASLQSVELTAPSAGTYYYGACVDAVAGESDTANNCSAAVQVDVPAPGQQTSAPDLVVGQAQVTDSNPTAGAAFTLSAEVRNGGDGDAAATTLRYYQSADATITASDTEVGTDAVTGLAAAATSSQSVELTAPSAGTYYYGACVDAVAGESDTANNCSAAVQVDVPAPGQQTSAPDLVVGQAQVTDSNPTAGAAFTLSAEVRNGGDGDAAATTLRYYQSADATITASDTEVGTDAVAGLAAAATSSQSVELTAPSAGTYYYGACVDAVAGESDTANNCSAAVQVDVPAPGQQTSAPDLVVGQAQVTDSNPTAGAAFTLSAEVRNGGDGDAAATTLRYYQSADATITASDTEVGTDAVAGLAAAATSSQSVELTAPSAGTYYYGACVDAVAGESDTANNCSAAVQVDVPAPGQQTSAPDLVVGQAQVTDSNPTAGAAFTLSAEVRNGGDGDAAATTLRYYQSADATITASDTEVGTDAVTGLAVAATSSQSVELTAPSAGTYYYGACVDAVAGESDTANNCSAAVQVDVPAPGQQTSAPDLEVGQAQVTDSNPTAGAAFTLSAEVRNGGDGDAAATTLRYYQSADATITASDAEVGTDAVAGLASSAASLQSVELTAPSAGTYYYGACVDAVAGESDTANNCSAAVQVDVPAPVPALPLLAQLLLALGLAAAGARLTARRRQR